ncbi:group II intron reverse transcriptase domain-containing protein [Candidatus Microgenomates bacterium]|nr:group II intron reverse transcriptase domain-containing protein [Candidatus Microgenomates bacterium]
MRIQLSHSFSDIISIENLLEAWEEFAKGKKKRQDVQEFSLSLMDNILNLHNDLRNHIYEHGSYQSFRICDPKPRHIHKASVRDRLLHHAVHRVLYPFFERVFIADSFSCRKGKGTHRAINRFRAFYYKVSKNDTQTCWILKCDIQQFFASIDHDVLLATLAQYIPDKDILWLLERIIGSFSTKAGMGLPLGNLTSQLFVNVYMNEFDQFVKHKIKARYYVRYADDFLVANFTNFNELSRIAEFLKEKLKLELHPRKTFVATLSSGLDFLGWVHFPDHRVLRTATKRRMMKRVAECPSPETLASYSGLLGHGNAKKLEKLISIGIAFQNATDWHTKPPLLS